MSPLNVAGSFSEDCLSLNVWTPAADDGKRPTMVWIHGGGFIWGAHRLRYMTVARSREMKL